MSRTRVAGLLIAASALVGCSSGGTQHVPAIPVTAAPDTAITGSAPPTSTPAPTTVGDRTAVTNPAEITIPRIGAHSTLIPLGLNSDGSLAVPDVHHPLQAGFYARGGVKPGKPGAPLVVAAHVNGAGQTGLFYRLHEMQPGDTAQVKLKDGTVLTFRVTKVESDPKDAFPGERVFGAKGHATLVLITCGGDFDAKARSYKSNIVAYSDLAS